MTGGERRRRTSADHRCERSRWRWPRRCCAVRCRRSSPASSSAVSGELAWATSGASISRAGPRAAPGQHRQPVALIYLSALAAAIGFRMNLFNIGVEGPVHASPTFAGRGLRGLGDPPRLAQHRRRDPGRDGRRVPCWAGIAGLLKVTRGVSEVISTIMLNAIAIIAGRATCCARYGQHEGNGVRTDTIPEGAGCAGSRSFPMRDSAFWRSACWRSSPASRFCRAAQQDAVRLRPAGDRASRRPRRSRAASTSTGWSSLDAALRRRRRTDLDAALLR